MNPMIATLLNAAFGYFINKHKTEIDTATGATTQIAPLPAIAALGVTQLHTFSSDEEVVIAVLGVLISAGLYFYKRNHRGAA